MMPDGGARSNNHRTDACPDSKGHALPTIMKEISEPASSSYDALLQVEENECTLDCGCRMFRPFSTNDHPAFAIKFCPMHEHAEKMRDALKFFLDYHDNKLNDEVLLDDVVLDLRRVHDFVKAPKQSLAEAAADLIAAIDGVTDQFDDEVKALQAALDREVES